MRHQTQRPLKAAFVGIVAPDRPEYWNPVFSRAGNSAQLNILKGLAAAGVDLSLVLSFLPTPSFPRAGGRLFVRGRRVALFDGCVARFLPFLNVRPLKQLSWGLAALACLIRWSIRERATRRVVLCYNLSYPPGVFIYLAARLTGAAVVPILFDVGWPIGSDLDSFSQRIIYSMTKWLIPRVEGRVVITESIARDLAPGKHFLHVDGGIDPREVYLPPPRVTSERRELVLGYAGSLWPINGIDIMLEAMRGIEDPGVRLRIAGGGMLAERVSREAAADSRIEYAGPLDPEQIRTFIADCDVLLNIRRFSTLQTPYNFPSKLFEYFAAGKPVISTPIAHLEREYGDYCFLLRQDSAPALIDVVRAVRKMDRYEVEAKGRSALTHVRMEKTWAQQGARMAAYLNGEVAGGVAS